MPGLQTRIRGLRDGQRWLARPQRGSRMAHRLLASTLALGVSALVLPAAHSQTQQTLLQKLRQMLGIQRPISVGGSRASLQKPLDNGTALTAPIASASVGIIGARAAGSEPAAARMPVVASALTMPAPAMALPSAVARPTANGEGASGGSQAHAKAWLEEACRRPGDRPYFCDGQAPRQAAALAAPPAYTGFDGGYGSYGTSETGTPGPKASGSALCLLSPWLGEVAASAPLIAITPSGAPPIVSRDPLAEVQILQGNTLRWQGRGSTAKPLANPLAWPLPPLQPGESLRLKLRRVGAEDDTFAELELRRPAMAAAAAGAPLATAPGSQVAVPTVERLQTLLEENRSAEAIEVLFQGELAGIPTLRDLAKSAMASGCTSLSTEVPFASW